jgi:Fur family transcriptional regulator, peroxide stress response regulator
MRVQRDFQRGSSVRMIPTERTSEVVLRRALEASGQRFTQQRAAVYRFLVDTDSHPTADEVFLHVRHELAGISLATVYKSLEALVGCGLAVKLAYADGSARYDGRTDLHHHVRCVECGRVCDVADHMPADAVEKLKEATKGFRITGYVLELTGICRDCDLVAVR